MPLGQRIRRGLLRSVVASGRGGLGGRGVRTLKLTFVEATMTSTMFNLKVDREEPTELHEGETETTPLIAMSVLALGIGVLLAILIALAFLIPRLMS